jgi:molybdate transport system ATP-binding protein
MLAVEVSKSLGDFRIAARFEAATAGITVLFGRSGAGKTSIVNMIAGLLRPDGGRIAVDGRALFDAAAGIDLAPERRRVGYVFQEARLFPHLSVRANLTYGRRFAPRGERFVDLDQVVGLLGLAGLLARQPATLSGGERQRVAIGRALLAAPRLLLMDEPLASLDAGRKSEILPYIERLRDDLGLPIVYVSHTAEEVVRLADTMVVLDDGRVAAAGPVEAIMSRLDLRPLTGRYEAGAVIDARIAGHDERFGLSSLDFGAGRLQVPRVELPTGTAVRVRIRARDVSIALSKPDQVSMLNVLEGRVVEIGAPDGPFVDLRLDVGTALWAQITARSLHDLGLAAGSRVYALIKAIAIDRHSLGRRRARDQLG